MNINEVKNNLLKVLSSLNFDKDVTNSIKDFVETYDGKNEKEFVAAMIHIIVLMISVQKLEIKASAFDELEEHNEVFNESFNKIKEDFDRINAGQEPTQPSQAAGSEE